MRNTGHGAERHDRKVPFAIKIFGAEEDQIRDRRWLAAFIGHSRYDFFP